MPKTKLHEVAELGQSLWLDFINRDLIESGKLNQWIQDGLRGMTSNPSIFNQVISTGADYDEKILALKEAGCKTMVIYDDLTVRDIREACDCFENVYRETDGLDGYVSLEINPRLAADTKGSIAEGRRLFKTVNRHNCMIKVPATPEGFPVIEELIAAGINVNVTLIFSAAQYEQTVKSYFQGLKRFNNAKGNFKKVRSVASVFVSRIDSTIDKILQQKADQNSAQKNELLALKGKAAVANSQRIFARAASLFASLEFQELAAKGANVQRVLWGSTSAKDPAYSDVKYVDELIGSPTVNTVPEKTLKAFMDHGTVKTTLSADASSADRVINDLAAAGIDIDKICAQLLDEGVKAFVQSFDDLIQAIETKASALAARK